MADDPLSNDAIEFKPWRAVWRVHPDADRMPMASPDEQEQLRLDIEHSGMLNPIEFLLAGDYEPEEETADDRIAMLDGRNRTRCPGPARLPLRAPARPWAASARP